MQRQVLVLLALALLALAGCASGSSSTPPGGVSQKSAEAARAAAKPAAATRPTVAAAAPRATAANQPAPQPTAAPTGRAADAARTAEAPGPAAAPKSTEGSESQPLPVVTLPGRMVIYDTEITLLVKDLEAAVQAISDLATQGGGYLAGIESSTDTSGVATSTVRIKVLPDRYPATMSQLRSLAVEARGEKATTQDVTEEYSDVQTQVASLEATHRQLLDLMSRAETVEEILKIQQQANQIKLQLDRLRGRAQALERLSDLATIAAKLQPAEAVLARDYSAVRSQLRQAEAQKAQLLVALAKAKTVEEENALRDKLAEAELQISRASSRLREIETLAQQVSLTLAIAPSETSPTTDRTDLAQEYIETRISLRRAESRQASLTRQLRGSPPEQEQHALREQLQQVILEIHGLTARLKTIQERATQLSISLPQLSPEQEAILAGTAVDGSQPDPLRAVAAAWEASLRFLTGILAAFLGGVVFLWWLIPLMALAAYLFITRRGGLRSRWAARRSPASGGGSGPPAV